MIRGLTRQNATCVGWTAIVSEADCPCCRGGCIRRRVRPRDRASPGNSRIGARRGSPFGVPRGSPRRTRRIRQGSGRSASGSVRVAPHLLSLRRSALARRLRRPNLSPCRPSVDCRDGRALTRCTLLDILAGLRAFDRSGNLACFRSAVSMPRSATHGCRSDSFGHRSLDAVTTLPPTSRDIFQLRVRSGSRPAAFRGRKSVTNRREFLQSAAVLSAAPLAGRAAFAKGHPSATLDGVILDERHAAAREFGAHAALLGARTFSIEGDITDLWQNELLKRWRSAPGAIAGLTERPALFLLERLGWEHGLRV